VLYPANALLRSAALSLVAFFALAATAAAEGDPVMPLAQVAAGMRCTGYSVIRGTDIVPFDVEVIDVIQGDAAAASPRILIRVSGPNVPAGVGPGFSGSPIYCADSAGTQRVIGAVSEGISEYGNDVALATPIELILGVPVDPPPATARRATAAERRARPLLGPVSFSGLAPPVAALVRRAATRSRTAVTAAPGRPRASAFPQQTLRPGSAFAVGLATGDISLGAIGTVTYVNGDNLWGFGHPLDGAGRRSLFLQDAYVYAVIDNPLGAPELTTYKLAAPGHDLGILTNDEVSAVTGRIGPLPAHFPLRVTARNTKTGTQRSVTMQIADEADAGLPTGVSSLSAAAPVAVGQAATTVLGSSPIRQSGSMCLRVQVTGRKKPLRFCNTYVGGGGGDDGLAAAPMVSDTATAISELDAYNFGPLHVTSVEANIRISSGLRQAFMLGAAAPAVARRGTDLPVRLRIRRVDGPESTRTIRVHVPRGMPTGERKLRLTGTSLDAGGAADELSIVFGALESDPATATDEAGPRTLDALAEDFAGTHRYDGVTSSFRPAESGADELQPGSSEAIARRRRHVYRDPLLRLSGEVTVPVTVVG
jgi:hypothetical protein